MVFDGLKLERLLSDEDLGTAVDAMAARGWSGGHVIARHETKVIRNREPVKVPIEENAVQVDGNGGNFRTG